jgi:AraC-like DNA-binding protein
MWSRLLGFSDGTSRVCRWRWPTGAPPTSTCYASPTARTWPDLSGRRSPTVPGVGRRLRRLRRAMEYVDAYLGEVITLADLASAAGLTRMHFAAQFKAATSTRPHDYLLRRRVERAQEMLLSGQMSVVEIGLSLGFETQSHFTSVFKRLVGRPPHAWRRAMSD